MGDTARILGNLVFLRVIEGVMQRLVAQPWNDRNERLVVRRTHRALGLA